jgi:hypothetical protein
MTHSKHQTTAETSPKEFLLALSAPYNLAGHHHESTCSIGMTMFSKRQHNLGDLLQQANLAMYKGDFVLHYQPQVGREAPCLMLKPSFAGSARREGWCIPPNSSRRQKKAFDFAAQSKVFMKQLAPAPLAA